MDPFPLPSSIATDAPDGSPICAVIVSSVAWLACGNPAAADPTIVAILLDDLGPGEIGPLAHRSVTPNIDALALSGVTFTDGYAPAPKCGPSRAGTLSMRQPQSFGFYTNQDGKSSDAIWGMPDEVVTFSELLQQAGYETWLIGKSHMGANPWQHPLAMGFNHFFGFIAGEHPYLGKAPGNPIYRDRVFVSEAEYLTDAFAREIIAALRAPGTKPKFVFALVQRFRIRRCKPRPASPAPPPINGASGWRCSETSTMPSAASGQPFRPTPWCPCRRQWLRHRSTAPAREAGARREGQPARGRRAGAVPGGLAGATAGARAGSSR